MVEGKRSGEQNEVIDISATLSTSMFRGVHALEGCASSVGMIRDESMKKDDTDTALSSLIFSFGQVGFFPGSRHLSFVFSSFVFWTAHLFQSGAWTVSGGSRALCDPDDITSIAIHSSLQAMPTHELALPSCRVPQLFLQFFDATFNVQRFLRGPAAWQTGKTQHG